MTLSAMFLPLKPDCSECWNTGLITLDTPQGPRQVECPDCTDDDGRRDER